MAEMSPEVMREALEAARGAKVATEMNSLPAQDASSADVDRGPTTLRAKRPGMGGTSTHRNRCRNDNRLSSRGNNSLEAVGQKVYTVQNLSKGGPAVSNDPLAQFRRPGNAPALPTVRPTGGKEPYEAYHLSTNDRRYLEVRPKFPNCAEAPLNALITKVVGELRMGLGVTITYGTSMVIDIAGENLAELFQAVKDWKVEWLQEFDPDWHIPPADPKAPFIKTITIQTTRPEAPPPVEKRH